MNQNKYVFNHMFSNVGVGYTLVFVRVDMKDKTIQENKNESFNEYDYITELSNEELNHMKYHNKLKLMAFHLAICFFEEKMG